jgi:hypothetical protein
MLLKSYRKSHRASCGSYKCCDYDGRAHREVRRTARRVEKQDWRKAEVL